MKLVRFLAGGVEKIGILEGDAVYEVNSLSDTTAGGVSYRLSEIRLLAPLVPSAIFCALVNTPKMLGVEDKETARNLLGPPKFFLKLPHVVSNPGDVIRAPPTGIRPEVEIGIVVKNKLKNATLQDVRNAILGYTVVNDVTAPGEFPKDFYYAYRRDPADGKIKMMLIRGPHFRNKNRDGFAPMGPWIVTADELPSISGLKMRSFYNGVMIQEGTTDELIYGVEELLIELSKVLTVPPNSVVCSGTVGYVGAEDPSEYKLQPMQGVMVAEVEKLGKLENTVAVEQV